MRRKKIVFLEDVINLGGSVLSTGELVKSIREDNRIDVYLYDLYGDNSDFMNYVNKLELNIEVINQKSKKRVLLSQGGLFQRLLLNRVNYIIQWYSNRKKIIRTIKENNIDFVVVNNVKILSLFIFQSSVKICFFARGWFVVRDIGWLKRIILKLCVHKYLSVSEATKQAIFVGGLCKDLENIDVVHNSIDLLKIDNIETTKFYEKGEKLRILLCGGFLKDKGHLVALNIASKLKEMGIDFQLVLCGVVYQSIESVLFYEELNRLVEEMNIADVVVFEKNRKDMSALYKKCNILIHPSSTEGLPRVVMEAIGHKLYVIANNVGGVGDFIINDYTGIIPRFNNVDDYCDNILKAFNFPEECQVIVDNAYNMLNKCYTVKGQLDSFIKVFIK